MEGRKDFSSTKAAAPVPGLIVLFILIAIIVVVVLSFGQNSSSNNNSSYIPPTNYENTSNPEIKTPEPEVVPPSEIPSTVAPSAEIRPTRVPPTEAPPKKPVATYFKLGSTQSEVKKIMGTPSCIHNYPYLETIEWWYGSSYITFGYSSKKVIAWHDLSGNLKVTMGYKKTNERYFKLGSTMNTVLNVMGTPSGIDNYPYLGTIEWWYDSSYITFGYKSKKVEEWQNLSGNLLVK